MNSSVTREGGPGVPISQTSDTDQVVNINLDRVLVGKSQQALPIRKYLKDGIQAAMSHNRGFSQRKRSFKTLEKNV